MTDDSSLIQQEIIIIFVFVTWDGEPCFSSIVKADVRILVPWGITKMLRKLLVCNLQYNI